MTLLRLSALGLGFLTVALAGCSSSSSTTTPDSGHPEDGQKPSTDAGLHDSGGGSGSGSGVSCTGIDAAVSGLTVAPACIACIEANCCMQAQGCANASGCPAIEACATKCVAAGTAPMTCAIMCIEGDSGVHEGGSLSPTQLAAETLDLCLASSCSNECS